MKSLPSRGGSARRHPAGGLRQPARRPRPGRPGPARPGPAPAPSAAPGPTAGHRGRPVPGRRAAARRAAASGVTVAGQRLGPGQPRGRAADLRRRRPARRPAGRRPRRNARRPARPGRRRGRPARRGRGRPAARPAPAASAAAASASSWRPSRDEQVRPGGQAGQVRTGDAAGHRRPRGRPCRSAPAQVAGGGQRAGGVDPGSRRPGRGGRARCGRGRRARPPRTHSPNRPSRISACSRTFSRSAVPGGVRVSGRSASTSVEQTRADLAGRRRPPRPRPARCSDSARSRRRARRRHQLRGSPVGVQRRARVADHPAQQPCRAGTRPPRRGRVQAAASGDLPRPFVVRRGGRATRAPRPARGGARRSSGAQSDRLGPERRRLGQRAHRAGVAARPAASADAARSARPARCRCRATSAATSGSTGVGLRGRLDRAARPARSAACGVGQVGAGRLGEQRVPEPQPPRRAPDQPAVQHLALGRDPVGQPEGGDLRRGAAARPATATASASSPGRGRRARRSAARTAGTQGRRRRRARPRRAPGRSPPRAAGCPRPRRPPGARPARRGPPCWHDDRGERQGRPSGPSSTSVTATPRPARSAISASASARTGRSRRVSTNSTGSRGQPPPDVRRRAPCWPGRRGARPRPPAAPAGPDAAHSTSRSTPSKIRSRSSSGAATGGRHPGPAQRRRQVRGQPAQLLRPPDVRRGRGHGADQLAGQLLPHGERRLTADVDTGPDGDPRARVVRPPDQLGDQAGLADPALAGHHDHPALTGSGRHPGRGQGRQLAGAPEQRPCGAVRSRCRRARGHQLGQHGPRRRPGRHAQLVAQPLRERPGPRPALRPGRRQRASRCSSAQCAGSSSGVQRAALPGPAHRRGRVRTVGPLGERVQQGRVPGVVLLARPRGPVLVQVGEQVAVAQLHGRSS